MIIRSKTESFPSNSRSIEFEEKCSLCEKDIPNDRQCLRHQGTNNILCIDCLVHIATLSMQE